MCLTFEKQHLARICCPLSGAAESGLKYHPMQKYLLILFSCLTAYLAGCQKSGPEGLNETKAHLVKANPASGGPAVDVFVLEKTGETVVPINKTVEWPQNGPDSVALKLVDTGDRYGTSRWRVVYIVSMRPL